MKKPEYIVLKG